jgi:N-acetylglucosamine kinase-like BadF-type ATPase
MRYFLGIDGGGTRTRAVIVSERGEPVGRGEGGSSNYHSVGLDGAFANIVAAVDTARSAAKLSSNQRLDAACLGLAGCGTDEDRRKLAPIAARLSLAPHLCRVESDMLIAHAGAFECEPGLILIAGTGSVCFGVDRKGNTARAGGWGPMFDDWGSAYDMGRRAIIHSLRAADGRSEPSLFSKRVAEALGGDLRAIAKLTATGDDRNRVASLAPIVFQSDRDGDYHAAAIITMVIEELAVCVEAVVKKLSFDEEIEIVVLGGLNNAGRAFFQPLYDAIRKRVPTAQIVSDMLPPVMGAALLALRLGNVPITLDVVSAMKKE